MATLKIDGDKVIMGATTYCLFSTWFCLVIVFLAVVLSGLSVTR